MDAFSRSLATDALAGPAAAAVAVFAVALEPGATARAQCQVQKLAATDAHVGAQVGCALAVDGSVAIVGAFAQDGAQPATGAAYVLVREGATWSEHAKLLAPDGATGDNFGFAVALDGDVAVVGADLNAEAGLDTGAAYVFERSGGAWSFAAKLTPSDAEPKLRFGSAVAVSGARVVVGMHVADDAAPHPGQAWLFERVGGLWSETAILKHAGAQDGDHYGATVAIDGDRIAIGAWFDDGAASQAGAVHVLEPSGTGWATAATLHAGDPANGARFGVGLALEGDRIVAGADEQSFFGEGAAYVFERAGAAWTQRAKLSASDGAPGAAFGYSVHLEGDRILVGARSDDDPPDSGSAYLVEHATGTWTEVARLTALDAKAGKMLGTRVGLGGEFALLGAPLDDEHGLRAGAVYSFALDAAAFPSLVGAPDAISLSAGGAQALRLQACQAQAGGLYLVLGSVSGTSPGVPLGAWTLPLAVDGYLLHTLNHPNQAPLTASLAMLDAAAAGTATFALPAGAFPSLAGVTANHAFVVIDGGAASFASTAAPLALLP